MKSWKTTVGGFLLAIGTPLQTSDDTLIRTVGSILASFGALMLGLSAKDSDVTGAGANARTVK